MWPALLALLIASFGLDSGANNDQAVAHLKTLNADQQAALAMALGGDSKDKIALLVKPKPTPAAIDPPRTADAGDGDDANKAFLAVKKKRAEDIHSLHASITANFPEEAQKASKVAALQAIADGLTLQQASNKIEAALGKALVPIEGAVGDITVGNDQNVESLIEAIPQALFLRANKDLANPVEKLQKYEERTKLDPPRRGMRQMLGKVHPRAMELRRMTLLGMYRLYLMSLGAPSDRLNMMGAPELADCLGSKGLRAALGGKIAGRISMLAESTSDFSNITLDAMYKSLRFFYLDAPRTWDKWLQRQTNPDFKNINRVVLSEAPSLESGVEGKEVRYSVLKDGKETYQLVEYKSGLILTRRAIINDDLNAFSAIPRMQANASYRLEEDTAYNLLINGTSTASPYAMSDGFAVFDNTNHANYTSSGTAISIASLQLAWNAIFTQKGLNNAAFLELQPKFLLVPSAIYWAVKEMIESQYVMGVTGALPNPIGTTNPFQKAFEVIPSVRLNANSSTAWYLAGDYRDGQCNTGELAFLEDEPEPVLKMETDFDTEDQKFLVRHTVAGKIVDFRPFYKNAGA